MYKMKKRALYYTLLKHLDHKNAFVITGMRQVGKTTLMKQLFDSVDNPKLWFDFDNPLDTIFFEEKDYKAIYKKLETESGNGKKRIFVFIDEIQNYPEITKIMKYHIDHFKVKYIVTGSSNFYLKNLFPESLTGRKFLFILNPLSFSEYLYFTDEHEMISEIQTNINSFLLPHSKEKFLKYEVPYNYYMEFGGFPEVVTTHDTATKKLVLKNIFSSFFEKDLNLLTDLNDIRDLRDLILNLVPRTGGMLDITKLSNELSLDRRKVYSYLEFLQGVFLIKLVSKFSKVRNRAVAGGKKVYFSDTGLLNLIGKVNLGQLFENSVANQLSEFGELSFYNKQLREEVDFILNDEFAFEVKLKATDRDAEKLRRISEKLGIQKYGLISKDYSESPNTVLPYFV